MLDHVSLPVTDMDRAVRFWDAVMAALGIPRIGRDEAWVGYGLRADGDHPGRSYLSLRRVTASPALPDAVHWAVRAPDRASVDAFWRAGLAAGGTDDSPPGPRPRYHADYYAAFLRDPDGNRIEAVCHRRDPG